MSRCKGVMCIFVVWIPLVKLQSLCFSALMFGCIMFLYNLKAGCWKPKSCRTSNRQENGFLYCFDLSSVFKSTKIPLQVFCFKVLSLHINKSGIQNLLFLLNECQALIFCPLFFR